METIKEILNLKSITGFVYLHETGDCIVWETEEDSDNDDGSKAIGRWQLTQSESQELLQTGQVNEYS